MAPGYLWFNIFMLALGTFAIRFSIVSVSSKLKVSERYKELFSFIPAAVLPALVIPAMFNHQGEVTWLFGKERFFILVLATAVSYYSRNMLVTICFGLGTLYLLTQM